MKIENNIEADQLIIALVARRLAVQAGTMDLEAEEALTDLIGRAIEERRAIVKSYRYLAAGETIQKGDEVRRLLPFEGPEWVPVQSTVGNPVRKDIVGDFRRPL